MWQWLLCLLLCLLSLADGNTLYDTCSLYALTECIMVWLLRKFCSPKICKEVISGKKKKICFQKLWHVKKKWTTTWIFKRAWNDWAIPTYLPTGSLNQVPNWHVSSLQIPKYPQNENWQKIPSLNTYCHPARNQQGQLEDQSLNEYQCQLALDLCHWYLGYCA